MLTTNDNLLILIGRLGQDPTINTKNGKEYLRFSVGQSDDWLDKETKLVTKNTIWHNLVVFENQKSYNFIKSYVRKGDKVSLHCQLKYNSYTVEDKAIQTPSIHLVSIQIVENSKTKNVNNSQSENYDGEPETTQHLAEDDIPF